MIRFKLTQVNPNGAGQLAGMYVPKVVVEETVTLDGLARHMAEHNSPFSIGSIKGLLTDAVSCIRELVCDGKNVKLDDLAIFSVGIDSTPAASREEFSVANNIKGVKFRARATGETTAAALNLDVQLKEIQPYNGGSYSGSGETPSPETPLYVLTLNANPANGGTVSGAGNYEEGEEVEILATPAGGYTFGQWSDGVTDSARTVTMTGDLTLTATFEATQSGDGGEDDENGGSLVG